jgi:hypothetical protein
MADDDENSPLINAAVSSALGISALFRVFRRAPDGHPIYQIVGQVASEWAHLEHTLDTLIWRLASINHADGSCITAQLMGATPRYRTLIAQLTHRAKREPSLKRFIKSVTGLMNKTYDIQEQRNRIIHDPWYAEPTASLFGHGPPAQFKSMPAKGLEFGITDIDLESTKKTLERVKDLSAKVSQLMLDVTDELKSSK